MEELEAVLAELRGGAPESTGRFTLHTSRAREKLRQYQLADPRRYVLLLIASAVAAGAQSIQLEASVGGLALVHDGDGLTQDDLLGLFSSPFVNGTRAALRLLALGVNSALSLEVTRLTIQSWRDGRGWSARFEGEEPQLAPVVGRPASLTTVQLHYKHRQLQEVAELLARECSCCPAELEVNGRPCAPPLDFGPCLALRHLRSTLNEPGLRLRWRPDPGALLTEGDHPAGFSALLGLGCAPGPELTLVVLGRSFVRELPWHVPGWGLRIVVATDRVRLDLAQNELVEDHVLENLQKALWNEVLRLVARLAEGARELSLERLRLGLPVLEFLLESECATGAFAAAARLCTVIERAWAGDSTWLAAAFYHQYSLIAMKDGDASLAGRLEKHAQELFRHPPSQGEFVLPDGQLLEARSYQRWLRLKASESVLGPAHEGLLAELESCAREAHSRRRHREVALFLRWLIRIQPSSEGLLERWLMLAEALSQLSSWEEAREAYRKALSLCPRTRLRELVRLFDGLALVETRRGDLTEAVDLLEGCVSMQVELDGQHSPKLHPLLMRLSELLATQGAGQRAAELRAWAGMLPQR